MTFVDDTDLLYAFVKIPRNANHEFWERSILSTAPSLQEPSSSSEDRQDISTEPLRVLSGCSSAGSATSPDSSYAGLPAVVSPWHENSESDCSEPQLVTETARLHLSSWDLPKSDGGLDFGQGDEASDIHEILNRTLHAMLAEPLPAVTATKLPRKRSARTISQPSQEETRQFWRKPQLSSQRARKPLTRAPPEPILRERPSILQKWATKFRKIQSKASIGKQSESLVTLEQRLSQSAYDN